PPGHNAWAGKPAAICGMGLSSVGTAAMQSHLRPVAVMLGMVLMGQPEVYLTYSKDFFDASEKIASESTEKFLRGFLENFSDWVKQHKMA
ncbi:NAD(P)H-dependent oxidoreductase, partial [Desulfosarcina sp. OttesenSCG-928-G17]|nr:NAD(P)H-dependent oxidoreductase [Desulfosarcina sp. OttesenSCG-928-G17]